MWAYLEITGLIILIKIASSAEWQNRTIRRSYGADSLSDLSAPRALGHSTLYDLPFSAPNEARKTPMYIPREKRNYKRLIKGEA